MTISSRTILVTGGAGYIGSHVCKALFAKGFTPIVYDNLSHGNEWAVKWGPFIHGDIHDAASLGTVIEHYGPLGAIHLAGAIDARGADKHPSFYYQQNVEGSRIVFQALLDGGISSVVFASSASVYGHAEQLPIEEEHPKAPLNAYGKSKWVVEEMLSDFEMAHGLRFAALRFFNACGADPEGGIGEAHPHETHFIPLAIEAALEQDRSLALFGKGQALRDFIHVCDVADATVAALEYLLAENGSTRLNIGSGRGHSLLQVLQTIEEILDRKVPYRLASCNRNESQALVANCAKAHEILNWKPKHSDMTTIIQSACAWYQQGAALCS